MALQVNNMERVFKHKDKELTDPDVNMTPKRVLEFYANQSPELLNANISGPNVVDDKMVYTFETVVGKKG